MIILTAIKDCCSFEALNVIGIDQLMQLTSVFLVLSTEHDSKWQFKLN